MSEAKRGRPSIPVWIDGVRFETMTEAKSFLKVSGRDLPEFHAALEAGGVFRRRRVSLAPGPGGVRPAPAAGPLLAAPCTHRLGTYGGMRV